MFIFAIIGVTILILIQPDEVEFSNGTHFDER